MLRHYLYHALYTTMVLLLLNSCNQSSASKDGEPSSEVEASLPGETATGSDTVSVPGETISENVPVSEEEMRQAALDGDVEKVRKLLDAGTNLNSPDQEGHTALMYAAFNGHTDIVLLLLNEGAVVDRRDLMGRTALLYASTGPFPETVKLLLEKGAEPNIVDSGEHFSPLMHAAAEGNMNVVKILLEYGADLSLTDVDNDDAESFAREAGHLQVAEYLRSLR
ncbi:MAG: ankyrin repeat domain-containing protein [Bacteroidota bacterium]